MPFGADGARRTEVRRVVSVPTNTTVVAVGRSVCRAIIGLFVKTSSDDSRHFRSPMMPHAHAKCS